MSLKTLILSIPNDLLETYIKLTKQTDKNRQEIIATMIYREFKINANSQKELESLDTQLYRKHRCHLDEWLMEHIEDCIIKNL